MNVPGSGTAADGGVGVTPGSITKGISVGEAVGVTVGVAVGAIVGVIVGVAVGVGVGVTTVILHTPAPAMTAAGTLPADSNA